MSNGPVTTTRRTTLTSVTRNSARVLRVGLVESVPMIGYGVKSVIDRDPTLSWVGRSATPAAAVGLCTTDHPDMVLIGSWTDPQWTLCQMLTGMFRGLMVMALIGDEAKNQAAINEARMNGVRGLIPAEVEIHHLLTAIRTTATRGHYIDPDLGAALMPVPNDQAYRVKPLSKREFEVLQFIAEGRTAEYVGKRLGITTDTVRTHVNHILRKLDARDRAHAVTRAFERSLLRVRG